MIAVTGQAILIVAAFLVALVLGSPYGDGDIVALVGLLGMGMGLQNATARALAVADLTTTVLTLTLTGISADSVPAGGKGSKLGRRFVSIAGMFLGGIVGTLLIEAHHGPWTLFVASLLLSIEVIAGTRLARSSETWTVHG